MLDQPLTLDLPLPSPPLSLLDIVGCSYCSLTLTYLSFVCLSFPLRGFLSIVMSGYVYCSVPSCLPIVTYRSLIPNIYTYWSLLVCLSNLLSQQLCFSCLDQLFMLVTISQEVMMLLWHSYGHPLRLSSTWQLLYHCPRRNSCRNFCQIFIFISQMTQQAESSKTWRWI